MRDFQLPGRSEVYASNGMCATSHPIAAKTAVDILDQGGNAVDAALAAAFVLGLAEPQMAGLGGDCFALIKMPDQDEVIALNGSGRAPAGINADDLRAEGNKVVPLHSAAAVTVPGAVDGFCRMSENWGRLGLDAVAAPAVRYAQDGIPVAPRVAFDWRLGQDVLKNASWDHYLIAGGAPPPGQVFRSPAQAEVLRRLGEEGRRAFYAGDVAEDMVSALRAAGGCHTLDDFAAAEASVGAPISGHYRGTELLEHPPNGQGVTALLMANILSCLDVSVHHPLDPYRAHLEIEASKLAYDARNRLLADPANTMDFSHLLSEATARELASRIDPSRPMPTPPGFPEAAHKDTVYLAVIDKDLMAVSLIYSIFHSFGSGIASPKYGILFHNRGAGFSLEPGHPNELAPGKRPMHTIIPAMLRKEGRLDTVFGVMGGQYQPTGHVRLLSNWVDFGMGLQEAIDAPRCFSENGVVSVERGYPGAVGLELQAMGHAVTTPDIPIGGAQAIRINYETGVLEAASDPRKDGCALGY